jgi:hypothetical protein
VPKICQKYQKLSKYVEIHPNPEGFEGGCFTGETPYFLHLRFGRCFLHTVEVTGSNPVSPIFFFPTKRAGSPQFKAQKELDEIIYS